MRTARADWVTALELEDSTSLLKSNPNLNYKRYLPSGLGFMMRTDKADLPFKDKRVRQALILATDFNSIKNDLYDGDAEIFVYPISPAYKSLYVPPKNLPESVRALYEYNPARAKQLLAEAGYPNGFKTSLTVWNAGETMDVAAAYKAMWAKVGVDVELQPKDFSVIRGIGTTRAYPEMLLGSYRGGNSFLSNYSMGQFTLGDQPGYVWFDDVVAKAFDDVQKNVFVDFPKADEIYKKLTPHAIEQVIRIPVPDPYSYTLWQPWIKNHYGERTFSWWAMYAWVDQDLKEKLTGRR